MKEYLIRLPWPPKELMPNFKRRHHWSRYQPQTRDYRKTCWADTRNALGGGNPELSDPLPMEIAFYPPDRRKRDDDGVIGAFKAGRDGLADALGVDDHTFAPKYTFSEPVKGGAVLVHIKPKEERE